MKILMAIDQSSASDDVFRAIVSQFKKEGTAVRVLHVLQAGAPAPPQMAPDYAPELEGQVKASNLFVEGVAAKLAAAGFAADCAVEIGDIREKIIDTAQDWGADLIVVGSHGQRGIQRFLLGSVPEFVARHAKCSVEIIRRPKNA